MSNSTAESKPKRQYKHSEETRRKISMTLKGHDVSKKTRDKIGQANKGENNYWFGKHLSDSTKKKIGDAQRNEKNHRWKGDDVSYKALHIWVRKNFPKPDLCMLCKKVYPRDLACITGIYNRELRNWAYLCQRCHCKWDNIGARNKIKQ